MSRDSESSGCTARKPIVAVPVQISNSKSIFDSDFYWLARPQGVPSHIIRRADIAGRMAYFGRKA
jgi:hypothetical protein